jgi:hypothetical protein
MCKCGNISSCASDCGCKFEVDAGCVRYSGVSLDSINIVQGDILETIITNISEVITNNGINTRITVADEPAGDNCAFGGTRISVVDKDTNEVIETQYVCASGNASVFELITYEELRTKIETSELDPGKLYKITDFQTIYDQPSYITGGDDLDPNVETKYADIDPIIVTATSSNTLDTFASQPGNPDDIIRYEFDYTLPFNTATPTKGRITYRKDNKGNECSWDFRTILFKRWINSGYVIDVFDNGGTFSEDTVFGNTPAFNNKILFDNIAIPFKNDPLYEFNPGIQLFDLPNIRIIVDEYCQGVDITGCIRNVTLSAKVIDNFTSKNKIVNTKITSDRNSFDSKILNNTFEGCYNVDIICTNISNNKFTNQHTDLLINRSGEPSSEIINNRVSYSESTNISVASFNRNTIDTIIETNLNGSSTGSVIFTDNNIVNFVNNNVGFNSISHNNIIEFTGFTTSNSNNFTFVNNNITRFNNITLENASNFSENTIEDFSSCTITTSFSGNRFTTFTGCTSIGASFLNNTGVNFKLNTVGTDCRNNNFGPDFLQNTVGSYFGFNGFISTLSSNTFKSQASNCTFGDYVSDNTFNSNLYNCIFDNDFVKNNIKTELQTIDFSPATHVYSNYNCKIYKNSADVNRLAYYDAFDSEQTVNITD